MNFVAYRKGLRGKPKTSLDFIIDELDELKQSVEDVQLFYEQAPLQMSAMMKSENRIYTCYGCGLTFRNEEVYNEHAGFSHPSYVHPK